MILDKLPYFPGHLFSCVVFGLFLPSFASPCSCASAVGTCLQKDNTHQVSSRPHKGSKTHISVAVAACCSPCAPSHICSACFGFCLPCADSLTKHKQQEHTRRRSILRAFCRACAQMWTITFSRMFDQLRLRLGAAVFRGHRVGEARVHFCDTFSIWARPSATWRGQPSSGGARRPA